MKSGWRTLVPSYEFDRNIALFFDCPLCNRMMYVASNDKRELFWLCKTCDIRLVEKYAS